MSAVDLHQSVSTQLREHGARYTKGRRALVEMLARVDRPITLPQLLAAGDGIAQSSAYRNLAVLESAGVIERVVTSDEFARYELAERVTGRHHHHLVCEECGTVTDFRLDDDLERELDRGLSRISRREGFHEEQHRLDIMGRCRDCAPT